MYQTLVRIYTDLIGFYFEATHILESGSFFVGVQRDRFKQKIPEFASSFADNAKRLDTLINVETYIGVQKLNDDQYSTKGKCLNETRVSKLIRVQFEADF
jgi:hypothetical protein